MHQKRHRKFWRVVMACSGVSALMLAPARRLMADTTSTWNGTTGNWSDATRWLPQFVPNNGNAGSNYAVIMNAGTLSLDTSITINQMSLTGGTLSGNNTLNTLGLLSWTGGQFGPGGGTVTASGGLSIGGSGSKFMVGPWRLVNPTGAVATWTGAGTVFVYSGAVIENRGTFNATNDATISYQSGAAATFLNFGTFNKSSTNAGTTSITAAYNNVGGTVNVTSGILSLGGGGTGVGGVFNVGPAGTLAFDNFTFNLDSATTVGGLGTVSMTGATVNVNGAGFNLPGTLAVSSGTINFNGTAATVGSLALSGGTLSGPGPLSVGALNWSAGQFGSGGGTTTVSGGLTITGSGSKFLVGPYRLINAAGATGTWSGQGTVFMYSGAVIENRGTFNATNDAAISYQSGAAATFLNSGTFNKSSTNAGTTSITAAFNNVGGTVNVTSGILSLGGGGTSVGGVFNAGPAGTLAFDNFNFNLDAATTVGGLGTVSMTGATVSVNGAGFNLPGTLAVSSGTIDFNGPAATVGSVAISGGTIDGSGPLSVSGLATWSAGQFGAGTGTMTVSGGLAITGSGSKFLVGPYRIVNAAGAAGTWSGQGTVFMYSGGIIENRGTFNATNDATMSWQSGALPLIVNSGVFNKSSTNAGSTTITAGFNNSGTVNVTSGTLVLSGGGTSTGGVFHVGPNGTLAFDGLTFNLDTATTVGGLGTAAVTGATVNVAGPGFNVPGALAVSSGTINFNGTAATAGSGVISGGIVDGSGPLSITGLLTWTGGQFGSGIGTTTVSGGLAIGGSFNKSIVGPYRLVNAAGATGTWSGPGTVLMYSGGIIENRGTFNATNDATMSWQSGVIPLVVNSGVFNKSSTNAGTTTITAGFNNSGTVNVTSGILSLGGGGTSTGGVFNVGPNGTLAFDGLTFNLDAATTVGGLGTAAVTGATVNVAGPGFNVPGTLAVSSGTINFNGTAATAGSAAISGGIVDGSGPLSIAGVLTWTGGQFGSGTGTTTASAGIAIGGSFNKSIVGPYRLINAAGATGTWSGPGTVLMYSGGIIENRGTFNATNDATMSWQSGVIPLVLNSGTFNKSSTNAGSTTITAAFNNSGTVNVTSGTLVLSGGGTSSGGVFNAGPNGTLAFDGLTFNLDVATTIGGLGTVAVTGATVNVPGPGFNVPGTLAVSSGTINFNGTAATAGSAAISGGIVDGSGPLSITGLLNWTGGQFGSGGGTTTLNGGMAITGSFSKSIVGPYRLVNPVGATTTWGGAGNMLVYSGALLDNRGTFNATNDAILSWQSGAVPIFLNSGTFNKSSTNAGTTTITAAFNNAGTVNVNTGTLSLSNGGTSTGRYNVAPGATLEFSGGNLQASSSPVANDGVFRQTTGVSVLGSVSGAGALSVAGSMTTGFLSQASVTVNSSGSLIISPGVVHSTNVASALQIIGSGVLDVSNHNLIVDAASTPYTTIKAYIVSARGGTGTSTWTGPGLTSSTVLADKQHLSLASASGTSGVNALNNPVPGKILIRPALLGDFNLDGTANNADISQLTARGHYLDGTTTNSWVDGDLNYDGQVTNTDISILLASGNYLAGTTFSGPSVALSTAVNPTVDRAFQYDPVTGDVKFHTSEPAGGNKVGEVHLLSKGNKFDPTRLLDAGVGGNGLDVATSHEIDLFRIAGSGSLAEYADGYDLGRILPTNLPLETLLGDLTVTFTLKGVSPDNIPAALVPEPTGLGLVGVGACGLIARRRRHERGRVRR